MLTSAGDLSEEKTVKTSAGDIHQRGGVLCHQWVTYLRGGL